MRRRGAGPPATVVTARVQGGATLVPGLLRDIDRAGVAVAAAEVSRPTLDDVFLALTGRSLRETGEAQPSASAEPPADGAEGAAHHRQPDLVLLEKAS